MPLKMTGSRQIGSPAERLFRTFADADFTGFARNSQELLAAGRQGVLDMAARKVSDRYGAAKASEFRDALVSEAEVTVIDGLGAVSLVVFPALMMEGAAPDAAVIAARLPESKVIPEWETFILLPEWRSLAALANLSPCGLRRMLVEIVENRETGVLVPAPAETVAAGGLMALVGVKHGHVPRDYLAGLTDEEREAAIETELAAEFSSFRAWSEENRSLFGKTVLMRPMLPSMVSGEVEGFMAEIRDIAGRHDAGADALTPEMMEYVGGVRDAAGGEEVVCRVGQLADGVEVHLLTKSGRPLGSRVFPLPVFPGAEESPALRAA